MREVVVEEGCGQPQEEAEVMQAASRPPALLKHMMQQAVQQEQEGQQEQEVQQEQQEQLQQGVEGDG